MIRWCEGLTITSGAYAGRKLALRPWQRAVLHRVYAEGPDGRRPVRTALISTGRKSGKSTLSAALSLVHLVGPEAVQRGQVIAAAADRNQASIIYAEAKAFALANPEIADRLIFREWNKTIEDTVTGSIFSTASSDHRKAHGTSPVVYIADEVAQWRGRELLDALWSGQGAHPEPLGIIISTRSPDPDSPFEELVRYAQQVEDGTIEDPTFIAAIYSAPPDADPWEPATWRLANPDADDVRMADLAVQAAQARRLPSMESSFRAYALNMPVVPDERFIGPADWDACAGPAGAEGPCYGGLDLASGPADLCAFALYWPASGLLKTWAFLPSDGFEAKAREDNAPYATWENMGHIIRVPGRVVDKAWLGQWLAQAVEGLDLAGIAMDRWGINDFRAALDREGVSLPLQPHGAGYKDMTPAVAAFEAEVLAGRLRHGASPLLRWAVSAVSISMDPAGGRKPDKQRSRGRIDPAVSAILAVALAAKAPAAPSYEYTGLVLA